MSIETVQQTLEKMVPELHDYKVRGLFSPSEIRSIVKKRTHFEYALIRRVPILDDFLRYIQYEMNLDTLRRARKTRLNLSLARASVSDFAIVRHIHFLFTRATRKFTNDLSLWLQYIDWAAAQGAAKRLDHVFPLALQHHPLVPALWLKAALYHYETTGNIDMARVYFQRGLRLNPASELLWREFFRMEVRYVGRLAQRKAVLGDIPTEPQLTQHKADLAARKARQARAEAAGEAFDAAADAAESARDVLGLDGHVDVAALPQLSPTDRAVLSGVVPLTIFRNALREPALAADPSFALGFLPLVAQWVNAPEAQIPLQAMRSRSVEEDTLGSSGGYGHKLRSAQEVHKLVPLTADCLRFVGADIDSLYTHILTAALALAPHDEAVWDARARAALLSPAPASIATAAVASVADSSNTTDAAAAETADAVKATYTEDLSPGADNADIGTLLCLLHSVPAVKPASSKRSSSSKRSRGALPAPLAAGYLARYAGARLLSARFVGRDAASVARYEQALHARPTPRMFSLAAAFFAGRLNAYSATAAALAADAAAAAAEGGAGSAAAADAAGVAAQAQVQVLVWRDALITLCHRAAAAKCARAPLLAVWIGVLLQAGAAVADFAAVDAALAALTAKNTAAKTGDDDAKDDGDATVSDPSDLGAVIAFAARSGALLPPAPVAGPARPPSHGNSGSGSSAAAKQLQAVGAVPLSASVSVAAAAAASAAAGAEQETAALGLLWAVIVQVAADAHTQAYLPAAAAPVSAAAVSSSSKTNGKSKKGNAAAAAEPVTSSAPAAATAAAAAVGSPKQAWARVRAWVDSGLTSCSDLNTARKLWRFLLDASARHAVTLALTTSGSDSAVAAAAAAAAVAEAEVERASLQLSFLSSIGDDYSRAVSYFTAAATAAASAHSAAACGTASTATAAAAAARAAAAASRAQMARAALAEVKQAYLEWALSIAALPLVSGPALALTFPHSPLPPVQHQQQQRRARHEQQLRRLWTRQFALVTAPVDLVAGSILATADDYLLAMDVEVRAADLAAAAALTAPVTAATVDAAGNGTVGSPLATVPPAARLRAVYEAAVARFGATNVAVWTKYMRCLLAARSQAPSAGSNTAAGAAGGNVARAAAVTAGSAGVFGAAEIDELNMVQWRAGKTLQRELRTVFALECDQLLRRSV